MAPKNIPTTTQLGINLPIATVQAIDDWAQRTGYLKRDGSINRSGAIRALIFMSIADPNYLEAALKARALATGGEISDAARKAYTAAHYELMQVIENQSK